MVPKSQTGRMKTFPGLWISVYGQKTSSKGTTQIVYNRVNGGPISVVLGHVCQQVTTHPPDLNTIRPQIFSAHDLERRSITVSVPSPNHYQSPVWASVHIHFMFPSYKPLEWWGLLLFGTVLYSCNRHRSLVHKGRQERLKLPKKLLKL